MEKDYRNGNTYQSNATATTGNNALAVSWLSFLPNSVYAFLIHTTVC